MLTFRKALLAAALVLTVLYLLSSSASSPSKGLIPDDNKTTPGKDTFQSKSPPQGEVEAVKGAIPLTLTTTPTPEPLSLTKQKVAAQHTLQDTSKLPLMDQLAYQFPYDVESKFPAYIWQTWKTTPSSGDFTEEFRPYEASWSEKHPGFIHEVITDQVAVHLMRHLYASIPDVLEAYNSLPMAILKADFFRYLILLARGGIYSDIDTQALKSALDWIPPNVPRSSVGLVIGIEADPDREDWAAWYSRRVQFCQWTIQAKSGHPVLRSIVSRITKETLKRKANGTLKTEDDAVVAFTGPAIWTDTIFEFFNDPRFFDIETNQRNITWQDFTGMKAPKKVGDVVVLPITSFSPGIQTMGAADVDDLMAFVKHEFEGTWKPESLRHIGLIYDENGNVVPQESDVPQAPANPRHDRLFLYLTARI